jgi:hypothetical protein
MRVPADQKTRGQWVELLFMARAAREGLKVAKPHGDERYDVIVESRTGLHRVQVKSTLFKRFRCYECQCYWSRVGANREVMRYRPAQVDFVAAYVVPENSWFIIPVAEIRTTRLYLPPKEYAAPSKYAKYREAWKLLGAVNGGLTIHACADVLQESGVRSREAGVSFFPPSACGLRADKATAEGGCATCPQEH